MYSRGTRQTAALSADRRELFEYLLQEEGIDLHQAQTISRRKSNNELPLSFSQQRLWFLNQLDPKSPLYNVTSAVHLRGKLDVAALERSLIEITKRHEVFRTTFSVIEGRPVQNIAPAIDLRLSLADLRDLPENQRESKAKSLVAKEAQRPFDLSTGPLLRASLLQLGEHEHVLLLVMHHIVSDAWSIGVLIKEVAALYEAINKCEPLLLEDLPIQYADYAIWQRDWFQSEVLEEQRDYWTRQLGGDLTRLELPTDSPRQAVQSFRGATESFLLPDSLLESLKALSRSEGATLFMTLLAAFKTLLYRYSGQEEIVVGTPVANRNRVETEGLIGFFINTLVLRTDLARDPSFRELLRRTREVTLGAYAHRDFPFEKLVEQLRPERSLSHSPLFQVMFVLQNAPMPTFELGELNLSPFEFDNRMATYDLTLSVAETEQGLTGVFSYSSDLFEGETISRMAQHFRTLLEGIIKDPEQKISRLPLLTGSEREQMLVRWNDTSQYYPADLCAHQLFEEQVKLNPDALAVVFEDEHLTYEELNEKANQLAHYLSDLGVAPEALVGICVERSLDMVVGLLGVLKAGGAYVPLDPTYPDERLAFILRDARVSVLLTQEHLIGRFSDCEARLINLDSEREKIAQYDAHDAFCAVTPDNLAYVIYTSGSTGQPKGVLVEHRGLCNLASAQIRAFHVRPDSRILQFASFGFDASVSEIFMALAAGASLRVAAKDSIISGPAQARLLTDGAKLIVTLPPSVLASLADEEFPMLRTIIAAGEACSAELVQRWARNHRFFNAYGPTETTVCATLIHCTDGNLKPPIGRPIANTQIYLLDTRLQPVPVGVVGEIYIGGVGVARGYINRPDITAERFIPDPFTGERGARLYKTGDLARYLSDGNIEFVGRSDFQVKIRGFRIELGEIEASLAEHPAVSEAVVLVNEEIPGEKRLVAYVVISGEPAPTVSEFRSFLKEKLPDYMLPSVFMTIDAMPLTHNGKVDRQALPAPDRSRPELERAFLPPRNPIEEMIAQTWTQLLGVERVGVHDDFFDLGGHSLLATQIIARLRDRFRVEISLKEFFNSPTIAGLAESINTATEAARYDQGLPLTRVSRDRNLPLSFAQQRLWLFDRLASGSNIYKISGAVRLSGPLDAAAMERALNEIVRRHEILRTTFPAKNGLPIQVIAPSLTLRLPLIDIQILTEDERELELRRLASQAAQEPFDLTAAPLLRASLVQFDDQEHVLLLMMHHIISDGWSMTLLVEEMATLYEAYSRGVQSRLEELPIQYADFAVWQRNWLDGELYDRQLSYWKKQLGAGPHLVELPTDRARPAIQGFGGGREKLVIGKGLTEKIKEYSRSEGVTLFMTLLAGFKVLLYRYREQDEIAVGTPIANRRQVETERLIGFFVNTVVMKTEVRGEESFREIVRRVKEVALGAYANQDMPFEKLVEEMQPERGLSHSPLFQVMFAVQNNPKPSTNLRGLTVSQVEIEDDTAHFDLGMSIVETEQGLVTSMEYRTDLFDRATINRLLNHFQILLEGALANPQLPITRLPLLSDIERDQLLVQWNDTKEQYPRNAGIHELFEAQAERTPEAVALVYEGQQMSYRELNSRANQLAHKIRSLGVGVEDRVAICVERTMEMVVALLGALKSAGAYVPTDATHPADRISYMVEDAECKLVVTQESLREKFIGSRAKVLCVDSDRDEIAQQSRDNPMNLTSPESLACMIYTSGTTGRPKAVMIEQGAIANVLFTCKNRFNFTSDDLFPSIASLSFDISLFEIIIPLLAGGVVEVLNRQSILDVERLVSSLDRFTLIHTVPSLMRQIVEFIQQRGLDTNRYENIRRVFIGGDLVSPVLLDQMRRVFPSSQIKVLYGPTEATIICSTYEVPAEGKLSGHIIGKPLSNMRVRIYDKYREPVPVGVVGEIYVAGDGVSRGYYNREDLTRDKYVEVGEERCYRTGDLGKWTADGRIEFIGRADDQVKIRGNRIEVGEIEAALREQEGVKEVAVVAREAEGGEKRLIAYVVEEGEGVARKQEMRVRLRERVPEYMVPSQIVKVEKIPLTPHGKLDRKALLHIDVTPEDRTATFVAPQTEVERSIAAVWQEVLQVEKVGIDDNFFDLGGHSLSIIQAHIKLQEVFNRELSVIDLFKFPTIKLLAKHLSLEQHEQTSFLKIRQRANKQKEARNRRKQPLKGEETSNEGFGDQQL